MPLTSDVRKKDVVQIKDDLPDEDVTKIMKFASRQGKNKDLGSYVRAYALKPRHVVQEIGRTVKDKTEYAVILLQGIPVHIQTRYLNIVSRKPKHPATGIFA